MADSFGHAISCIDEDVSIGVKTKIRHCCQVQRCARIGTGCSPVCEGVELEDDVFCGPSCVFTNDHALVAGIPARQIGWVCECGAVLGEEKLGERIGGWAHKRLVCQSCGREYVEVEAGLKEK